jgi:pimeloyl-ACP methyl ester carboxylesterase
MGRSMGANTALEIAANHAERFRGLVIESGAGNVKRLVARAGVSDSDERAAALISGHEEKLRRIELPTLIIHGERDELIPLPYAAELYGMLESAHAELLVINGAGHNDLLWRGQREYFEAIGRFVAHETPAT